MSEKWKYFIGGFGVALLIVSILAKIDIKRNYVKKPV
jgi:hypothetical protein